MKLLINVLGLAAAGYLGYLLEPGFRPTLTGQTQSKIESGRNKTVILKMPGDSPQIELSKLTPAQLPAKVLLKSEVKFTDLGSGMNMVMQAGNRVKLVRIEGGNAVVSPGEGPFYGLVPVTETDLFQQLSAGPIVPKVTPEEPASPAPIVAPIDAPIAPPEELVKTPEPPVIQAPQPEPTPTEEPAADTEGVSTVDPEQIVKAMQASIKNAEIKEFTYDRILEWKADVTEIIDGETYQTGLASYEAETIFGTKKIQAKALIKGGKVRRWVWPKSGADIK